MGLSVLWISTDRVILTRRRIVGKPRLGRFVPPALDRLARARRGSRRLTGGPVRRRFQAEGQSGDGARRTGDGDLAAQLPGEGLDQRLAHAAGQLAIGAALDLADSVV